MFLPYAQFPAGTGNAPPAMHVVLRAAGDPSALATALGAAVAALDPDVPLSGVQTMEAAMGSWAAERRLIMLLVSGVRARRPGARLGGHLRRDGAPGGAARARDRRPHGARRAARADRRSRGVAVGVAGRRRASSPARSARSRSPACSRACSSRCGPPTRSPSSAPRSSSSSRPRAPRWCRRSARSAPIPLTPSGANDGQGDPVIRLREPRPCLPGRAHHDVRPAPHRPRHPGGRVRHHHGPVGRRQVDAARHPRHARRRLDRRVHFLGQPVHALSPRSASS